MIIWEAWDACDIDEFVLKLYMAGNRIAVEKNTKLK
jgi:hypothetical protein